MKDLIKLAIGAVSLAAVYSWLTTEDEDQIPIRRVFVSHSWKKGSKEYRKFVKKLDREEVEFYNHSIPKEEAFDTRSRKELELIFRNKMKGCSKIFVLAKNGMSKHTFVSTEMDIARELGKDIIAVKPHGQYGMPSFIKKRADKVISNNIDSIIRVLRTA